MKNDIPVIRTERLLLRGWREEDRAPFAALNADPRVVRYLLAPLTRRESDEMMDRIGAHFREHGFGLWAVETLASGEFAGFVGLSVPRFEADFTPCVEVGWRLAHGAWGQGLATEGARAALAHGFGPAGLEEIVSFTVPANRASWNVMQKIGMTHDRDFDHPSVPAGHELKRHVLYRITAEVWRRGAAGGA